MLQIYHWKRAHPFHLTLLQVQCFSHQVPHIGLKPCHPALPEVHWRESEQMAPVCSKALHNNKDAWLPQIYQHQNNNHCQSRESYPS